MNTEKINEYNESSPIELSKTDEEKNYKNYISFSKEEWEHFFTN